MYSWKTTVPLRMNSLRCTSTINTKQWILRRHETTIYSFTGHFCEFDTSSTFFSGRLASGRGSPEGFTSAMRSAVSFCCWHVPLDKIWMRFMDDVADKIMESPTLCIRFDEVSVAPRPLHCSLSLHCAALESVIFHNIRVRKSFMASLGVGAWEWNKSSWCRRYAREV